MSASGDPLAPNDHTVSAYQGRAYPKAPPFPVDAARLEQLTGTALIRNDLPELPMVSLYPGSEPYPAAFTCPTTLENRRQLLSSGPVVPRRGHVEPPAQRLHRLRRIMEPNQERQTMLNQRAAEVERRMAKSDRPQGHRRLNQYINSNLRIGVANLRLMSPTDDLHYKGILLEDLNQDVPDSHDWDVCTGYLADPTTGCFQPNFWEHCVDHLGHAFCGDVEECWLCASRMLGPYYLDQVVRPRDRPLDGVGTLGSSLNHWLKMLNFTFVDDDHAILPLTRRWAGLDQSDVNHLSNLILTSWTHWYACYLTGEANYKHFVKLGGVRLPTWRITSSREHMQELVSHFEIYYRGPPTPNDPGYYTKLQVTKEICDSVYAGLWNATLQIPHGARGGKPLTNFEKANAIDTLIGLGRALRFVAPITRQALYAEIGNIEQMSFFWEILLDKFAWPWKFGLTPCWAPWDWRNLDDERPENAAPAPTDQIVDEAERPVSIGLDHPIFQTPSMAWAIVSSESRNL